MEGKLDSIEALEIISGQVTRPLDTDQKNIDQFDCLNRKAYNLILDHLDSDNLSFVAGSLPIDQKRNGRALWNLLLDRYMSDDFVNKTLAFAQFNKIEFQNNIVKFVNQIRTATQKMRLVGFKLENKSTIILTLSKLPNQFNYLKKSNDYQGQTVEYLLKKLEKDHTQDQIED